MNPINFDQVNQIMGPPEGMTEEECMNLPVAHAQTEGQEVFISCWEMSEEELQLLIKTRKIWVWQFGDHVQPISISANYPFEEAPRVKESTYTPRDYYDPRPIEFGPGE